MVKGNFTIDRTWVMQEPRSVSTKAAERKSIRLDQITSIRMMDRGPEVDGNERWFVEFGNPKTCNMAAYYTTEEEAVRDYARLREAVDRAIHGDRKDERKNMGIPTSVGMGICKGFA